MNILSLVLLLVPYMICEGQLMTNKTYLPRYEPTGLLSSSNVLYKNLVAAKKVDAGRIKFDNSPEEANKKRYGFNDLEVYAHQQMILENSAPFFPNNVRTETEKPSKVTFETDNRDHKPSQTERDKKFRKNRRKARKQIMHLLANPMYPKIVQPNPYIHTDPFHGSPFYRPPPPQPTTALDALASITTALKSIARYDNYQCVSRLLCEAAAGALGSTTPGSAPQPPSVGLQTLLTLLTSYSSISSSPLFVFGRAAYLGMTSKNNPGACRYAYPLCPTDPEELIHYLNNHNGGFFRFFQGPEHHQPHHFHSGFTGFSGPSAGQVDPAIDPNVYSGLAGLAGLLRPAGTVVPFKSPTPLRPGVPGTAVGLYGPVAPPHAYGLYQPYKISHNQQRYGLHPHVNLLTANRRREDKVTTYRQVNNFRKYEKTSQDRLKKNAILENRKYIGSKRIENRKYTRNKRIEKRILKTKASEYTDFYFGNVEANPKWIYTPYSPPRLNGNGLIRSVAHDHLHSGKVKFPEQAPVEVANGKNNNGHARGFTFPEAQTNRDYSIKDRINTDKKKVDLVYIVRGNGDPKRPEIVEVRPGEKLSL